METRQKAKNKSYDSFAQLVNNRRETIRSLIKKSIIKNAALCMRNLTNKKKRKLISLRCGRE